MSQPRSTTTGIFLIVLLAVVGYVLWTMPHKLVDGYAKATQISPWVGYIYLAIVGVGGVLLAACSSRSCFISGRTRGRNRRSASGAT